MPDLDFYNDYYEQPQLWGRALSTREEERIQQTLRLIPEGCNSILEVGCGDGRIINRLASQYKKACGLDSSQEALRHVKTETIRGGVDRLPFSSQSFDLILCCEVLEHLPFRVYLKALEELQRVAAKYTIISVPYKQVLTRGMTTCLQCGCVFRPDRHLRSFDEKIMASLFKAFSLHAITPCQPSIRVYFPVIIPAAKLLNLTVSFPPNALCPQCGYTTTDKKDTAPSNTGRKAGLRRSLRLLARRLMYTKKYPGWLIALYHREP